MEEQKKRIFKKRCVLATLYIALLLCCMITFDYNGAVRFAYGYYVGNFMHPLMSVFLFSFLGFIALFVILTIELVISLRKNAKKKKIFMSSIIKGVILSLASVYALLSIADDLNSAGKSLHEGLFARVKNNININDVREWLTDLDEETFKKWSFGFEPEKTDSINVPKGIFELKPGVPYMILFENEQGERCVDLQWGGVFWRWGVVIGPKEMEVPSSNIELDGLSYYLMEEGVYSWDQ